MSIVMLGYVGCGMLSLAIILAYLDYAFDIFHIRKGK